MVVVCIILFCFFALRSIFFWVYLWQLKEYRLDRLVVHIKDTEQGRTILFSSEFVLLLFALIAYSGVIFSDTISQLYPFFVTGIFLLFTFFFFRDVVVRNIKRPVFTPKAISICGLSFGLVTLFLFVALTDTFLWLIIAAMIIPFIVAFFVFLFAFPTEIYIDMQMQKAKKLRNTLKKLVVIAVSGSYGKSSTKEIIAQLLSKKYRVVKTNLSNNTPLAIARTMLTKLSSQTEFFIVEIGAYKRGEIAQIVDFVKPTVAVTTAISDQHLALYGSFDNVILSELELFQTLSKNALVLLNHKSAGVITLAKKIKQKNIIWFESSSKKHIAKQEALASDIIATPNGVSWKYSYQKKSISIKSPLLGVHSVENMLPAIFLAHHYGMTDEQIQKNIKNLSPMSKTMEKKRILPGITIVDDSFNASPESVLSAIAFLRLAPKRKILVLSPLIELGLAAKIRHVEIGKKLATIDILFLTNNNFLKEIKEGIDSVKGKTTIVVGNYVELSQKLQTLLRRGDTVVFEGKEAGIVLKKLL